MFGIIFATSIIAIYYYFFDTSEITTNEEISIDTSTAKNYLLNENYVVMTEQELINAKDEAVQEAIVSLLNEENPNVEVNEEITTYSLVVKPGMNATTIANLLNENGVVTDANEFQLYLTSNGYSKKIRVGTYELNSNLSFKEIAQLLTTIPN